VRAALGDLPPVNLAESRNGIPGIVDQWSFFYDEPDHSGLLVQDETLITEDECERRDRFHLDRDRRLFVATRIPLWSGIPTRMYSQSGRRS
jgi:hypothetical protein